MFRGFIEDMTTQIDRARSFAALHVAGEPILLPNAWDVASARIVAAAGARAVATTSAGMAWSAGHPDGGRLGRDEAIALLARITHAVDQPVSADIERGYGESAEAVAETIAACLDAGAVGVNLEDSLRPVEEQQLRISAARSAAEDAGVPLFINARIDTHALGGIGGGDWLDETVARARAYAEAGASGIFVLGALGVDSVRALTGAATLPVNVAFGPGTLSIGELATAGASRISAGSSIAEAAYSLVAAQAASMLAPEAGVAPAAPALGWAALNGLVERA